MRRVRRFLAIIILLGCCAMLGAEQGRLPADQMAKAIKLDAISIPSPGELFAALEKPGLAKAKLDSEGYLKGTRGISFKALAGGLTGLGALSIGKATLAAGSAVSTFVPVGGAAVLGFAALWPRGNDVNVPPDTNCRIRLNYPVTVRIRW